MTACAPCAIETSFASIPTTAKHVPTMSGDRPSLVVVYQAGKEYILDAVADVLGRPAVKQLSLQQLNNGYGSAVGVSVDDFMRGSASHTSLSTLSINTHCVDDGSAPDERLTEACDYEFFYYSGPFLRRHLTRFLSFVLGESSVHDDLSKKKRTNFISTTFPDVRTALPNLDILSVGSDAVEIRVDLLKEPLSGEEHSQVPSLKYVGSQVAQLRQRTELPIIYTTRCTRENGKFPMDDPELFYKYLLSAIKWGIEYIDVELWLPENMRRLLWEKRGHSLIMSAFHDFSGNWRWMAPEAEHIFRESLSYAHIVKMIAMVTNKEENFALECFRSTIEAKYPHALLSAVNMGQTGQMSRALNTVFSPITHPLLPMVAAPGQLTAAEINGFQHVLGQLPKRDYYAIGSFRATPESVFMEKCFNELGLPHNFTCMHSGSRDSIKAIVDSPNFGGAYAHPPLTAGSVSSYLNQVTESVQAIGMLDTITVQEVNGQRILKGNNALWKGIREALTRDYVPSAYRGRSAIVISNTANNAAAAIYALQSLNVGKIYTVGFQATGQLASGVEPLVSLKSMQFVQPPFAMVSALAPEKNLLVQPLLKHFSPKTRKWPESLQDASCNVQSVYLDLSLLLGSNAPKGDPQKIAAALGWMPYGAADVHAWTMVETLRLLAGQNVPFDFVRMASGKGFC